MSTQLVKDFEEKLDSPSIEVVNLVDILLDSHTSRMSQRDFSIRNTFYPGVIKSISAIRSSREIDAGIEQSKSATIVFADSEFRFRDILEFEEIYNRRVGIREIDLDITSGSINQQGREIDLMSGVIDDYSWDDNNFTIRVIDISRKIYSDLPKYAIQKDIWPNAVDVGNPYPIIGGLVTKVPIFLVDNVLFQYLACLIPSGHTIRSDKDDGTFKVFFFENQTGSVGSSSGGDWVEIDSSNYSVSKTTDANGTGVFIIVFTSDVSGFQLSVDIEGVEDSTPATYTSIAGSLITNHADFTRFLFENPDNLNVVNTDINIPSFLTARRILDTNFSAPPTVSVWIGEAKNGLFVMEDLSLAMRRSIPTIGTNSFLNRYDGSWSYGDGTFFYGSSKTVSLNIIPKTTANTFAFVCDQSNIISPISFTKKSIADLKNNITINGDKNHSDGKFRLSSSRPSNKSQTIYLTTKDFIYNCISISDQAELDELAEDLRDFEFLLPFIVTFTLNASGLILNRSDPIVITHDKASGQSPDVYDGTWSYGDGTFVYGRLKHQGWLKRRAEILTLNKKKTSVDITAKVA